MVTLKNKSLLILWALGVCLFASNKAEDQENEEFRPFRPAIVLIGGLKSAVAALQGEIDRLESEAVGVPSLKDELNSAKNQLANIKNNFGIAALETQQEGLKRQFDGFAQRFFKTAQIDDSYMYYDLNGKITDMIADPEVQRRLDKIVQLKREIAERLQAGIKNIVTLGQQINQMTTSDQSGLANIKMQLAILQQRLTTLSVSDEVRSQVEPLEQKISGLQQQINKLLALRFTDDRLNVIARYKNRMRQYQLLLDYLRDPSLIPLTTEDKILATD